MLKRFNNVVVLTGNLRLDGRNLVQRWELLQQGKNKKYKYVWRKQDFDAVDPNDTDYLLGKKTVMKALIGVFI